MLVTRNWIEKNYNKFNQELWNGMLPNIEFVVSRARNSWGMAYYKFDWKNDTIIPEKIAISNYYDSPENVKIQTLLHEMIHIADYTFHPEHFIRNGRRVTGRQYDAHGYWFTQEAKRISKESGYKVTNRVTKEESRCSKLSDNSVALNERKANNALVCVVTGDNGTIFYFKTDIYKVKLVKQTIKLLRWYKFNTVKTVKFYTFDDPKLAEHRSCGKSIRGWYADRIGLMNFLKRIKATEVKF